MRKCLTALSFGLALILMAISATGALAAAQKSVQLDTKLALIDLADGDTFQLNGAVLPSGASQKMVWRSSDKSVATVTSNGLITANSVGSATIGARPAYKSAWTKATVKVTDRLSPTSIKLNKTSLSLRIGSTYQLTATVVPDTAIQTLAWVSGKSSVASVSADGLVSAKREGTAVIRASSTRNSKVYRRIVVNVKRLPKPTKFTISPTTTVLRLDETLQLSYAVSPSTADPSVQWSSSDRAIATVDKTGLVTPKRAGSVRIRVRSRAYTSVYTIRTMRIVDPKAVTKVVIDPGDSVLLEGGRITLSARALPDTCDQDIAWSSNNPSVATVDAAGVVKGIKPGSATITAAQGGKSAAQRVVVLDETPVQVVPAQITSVDGISENLSKIDDVLRYATAQISALQVTGEISSAEATARKTILLNAFRMARFPWLSTRTVAYWQGSARYRKNVVYYGLPYTQTNRRYNVSKSVKAGAFKLLSGNHHYTAHLTDRTYPGNDCSSFVSMCQWGTGSGSSFLRSWEMKSSSAYRTVATRTKTSGYQSLRPGDIFVRNGHVAMFLYYTNSLRSRIMIVQQGGLDSLNTVACTIKPLTYYSADSRYIARRKKSFA
jgi:uncharacterized protein YjdB